MSGSWIKIIANSKDAALVLSLMFNMVACGALWRLWKSREAMQDRVTGMLADLVKELSQITVKILERMK